MTKSIRQWLESIVFALVIALLVNAFLFQRMVVAGPSMEPNLKDGESLFVHKVAHTLARMPAYGDVVVLDSRIHRQRTVRDDLTESFHRLLTQPDYFYVKRVIGHPGDAIEIRNGQVLRNGQPLDEPYTKDKRSRDRDRVFSVPPGHVFVMGDNRNNSMDSRYFGSIPLEHCLGIVFGKL